MEKRKHECKKVEGPTKKTEGRKKGKPQQMKDWLGGGQERWEGRRRDEVWRQIRSKRINGTKERREREKGYRISARRKSLPLISEGERATRRTEK